MLIGSKQNRKGEKVYILDFGYRTVKLIEPEFDALVQNLTLKIGIAGLRGAARDNTAELMKLNKEVIEHSKRGVKP